jgi:hypothetical protein
VCSLLLVTAATVTKPRLFRNRVSKNRAVTVQGVRLRLMMQYRRKGQRYVQSHPPPLSLAREKV